MAKACKPTFLSKNPKLVILIKDFIVQNPLILFIDDNPLSANFTKWSNPLKQFAGNLPTNCLSVFDHFMGLALKGII